jgi:hypothetical protein
MHSEKLFLGYFQIRMLIGRDGIKKLCVLIAIVAFLLSYTPQTILSQWLFFDKGTG